MDDKRKETTRQLVIPGELLSEGELKAGKHTYRQGKKVYASQLGFRSVTANYVNVIPLSGRYIPRPDDLVIGVIMSVSPTTWLVDINSPYPAPLHVNEVPWRVEFGETSRYLNTGDTILARVFTVDEIKRVQVTMRDQGARKLTGGEIIEISPSKVPRVIGKGGSMISQIKQRTMCRLFVGQNGRIWIDGEPENIRKAVNAIRYIERESHKFGLTEAVDRLLRGEEGEVERVEVEDEPVLTPEHGGTSVSEGEEGIKEQNEGVESAVTEAAEERKETGETGDAGEKENRDEEGTSEDEQGKKPTADKVLEEPYERI